MDRIRRIRNIKKVIPFQISGDHHDIAKEFHVHELPGGRVETGFQRQVFRKYGCEDNKQDDNCFFHSAVRQGLECKVKSFPLDHGDKPDRQYFIFYYSSIFLFGYDPEVLNPELLSYRDYHSATSF